MSERALDDTDHIDALLSIETSPVRGFRIVVRPFGREFSIGTWNTEISQDGDVW